MTGTGLRALRTAVSAATLLGALLLGAPGGAAHPGCALADSDSHGAVVVHHANGSAEQRICVGFNGAAIGAEQILAGSGLEYRTAFYPAVQGDAVCQVDYEPNAPGPWTSDNCLGSQYWGLYVSRRGGPWSSSQVGISDLVLADGDALGLAFGAQPQSPKRPQGICPSPQPTPSPTSQAYGRPAGSGGGRGSPPSPGGPSSAASATAGSAATGAGTGPASSGSPGASDREGPRSVPGAPQGAAARVGSSAARQATGTQGGLTDGVAGLTAALLAVLAMAGLLVFNLVRGGRSS
jgi:hypothetical protein